MKRVASAVLAFFLVACAPEDILLGARLATDAGTPAPSEAPTSDPETTADASTGERACRMASECGGNEYCSKDVCGFSVVGKCKLLPTLCDNERELVCGCDGVTYWNDCLRRSYGISASSDGPCDRNPYVCGGPQNLTCPNEDFFCAKRVRGPSQCAPDPLGVCWALPADCGAQPNESNRWSRCGAPPGECLDACSVIKREQPYFSNGSCTN